MNRQGAKDAKVFWFDSGTPADRALAGDHDSNKVLISIGQLVLKQLKDLISYLKSCHCKNDAIELRNFFRSARWSSSML
jgi:hypothetical protein